MWTRILHKRLKPESDLSKRDSWRRKLMTSVTNTESILTIHCEVLLLKESRMARSQLDDVA
jgi:hypothetical protein